MVSSAEIPVVPFPADAEHVPEAALTPDDAPATEIAPPCPFCGAPLSSLARFCPACGQPGTSLAEGAVLRSYQMLATLSVSSTGAVYRAHDTRRKREVALKEVLSPVGGTAETRAAFADRFMHEARQLAHLKHPCLPEVLDSFAQDGRYYLVMPLLPGADLQALLAGRGQPFSEQQVREWALRLLDLLTYLEARHPPWVHGEIQPSHIMLRQDNTPCLVSYGLAPRLALRPYLQLAGQVVEEQPAKKGKKAKAIAVWAPGPRDDLYGLGATLHSLLTGRDVFAGADDPAHAFPPVRALAPRVKVGTAEVIGQALATEPRRRFASAGSMRAAFVPSAGPVIARTRQEDTPRSPVPALALALIVVVLLGGIGLYAHQNATSTAPERPTTISRGPSRPSGAIGEANPLVAGLSLPVSANTNATADAFIRPSREWPEASGLAYRRESMLWLDNSGAHTLKLTRTSYATGLQGFTVEGVVRLVRGAPTAGYGIIAADRSSRAHWSNVALQVRASGQWALVRYRAGGSIFLSPWKSSDAIRRGHNTPNDLRLTLTPGAPGLFAVTINGRLLARHIPAWSHAPNGRIGIIAGAGAQVVSEGLRAGPPSTSAAREDDFLDNHNGWSVGKPRGSTPLIAGGLLHLRVDPRLPLREAAAHRFAPATHAGTYTIAGSFTLHAAPLGHAGGGLVFARPAAGVSGMTLAVVIGGAGQLSVVAIDAGTVRPLDGPVPNARVRVGYGMNVLTVHVTIAGGTLRAEIAVNDGTAFTYSGPANGLVPAARFIAIDPGTTLTASVIRLQG